MANKIKGEVSLAFEGQDYTLVLDFNALAEFEEAAGVDNALEALQDQSKLGARGMRALFWAGLKQRHPEMTMDLAGRILTSNIDKLGEALGSAFPEAPEGNETRRGKAARR